MSIIDQRQECNMNNADDVIGRNRERLADRPPIYWSAQDVQYCGKRGCDWLPYGEEIGTQKCSKKGIYKKTSKCHGNGYDLTNKRACCLGQKNDNQSCAKCWFANAPADGPCMSIYDERDTARCSTTSIDGKTAFDNDPFCDAWLTKKPALANAILDQQCVGGFLNSSACQTYCASTDVNCDARLVDYCSSIGTERAKDNPICGCFMPQEFYSNYFSGLESKVSGLENVPPLAPCFYGRCSNSTLQQNKDKGARSCPNINNCISNVEINNEGTIVGNVSVAQSSMCNFQTKSSDETCNLANIDIRTDACRDYCTSNPTEPACVKASSEFCAVPSFTATPRVISNSICAEWCAKNDPQCNELKGNYCSNFPFSPDCAEWCIRNGEKCSSARHDWCATRPNDLTCKSPEFKVVINPWKKYLVWAGLIGTSGALLQLVKDMKYVGITLVLVALYFLFLGLKLWHNRGCESDAECPHISPICRTDQKCVSCLSDSQCLGNQNCVDGECKTVTECSEDKHCADANGTIVGKTSSCIDGKCIDCRHDADCLSGTCREGKCVKTCADNTDCPHVCSTDGKCIECSNNIDCAGNTGAPFCSHEKCKSCLEDKNCPSGHCNDGNCVDCTTDAHCSAGHYCTGNKCAPLPVCTLKLFIMINGAKWYLSAKYANGVFGSLDIDNTNDPNRAYIFDYSPSRGTISPFNFVQTLTSDLSWKLPNQRNLENGVFKFINVNNGLKISINNKYLGIEYNKQPTVKIIDIPIVFQIEPVQCANGF